MKPLASFLREAGRMQRDRATMLLSALAVTGVVWFCLNSGGKTATDAYVLNAARSSAALGALLFTLLTLTQFYRDDRYHTDVIVLTCTDPVIHQVRRTLALVCAAAVNTLAVTLFALPYALIRTGSYFQASAFAASWLMIYLGALVFSVLLSSGLYMLFRRVEPAFVAMVGLITLSLLLDRMSTLRPGYLLYWVQTNAVNFSDLVSNQFQIDVILWNRLFWTCTALGVWSLGLLCLRRYGRGLAGSAAGNAKRVWMPALLAAMVVCSVTSYMLEPLFDHSVPVDYGSGSGYESGTGIVSYSFGADEKESSPLLLLSKRADADVDTAERKISGEAEFTLRNLTQSEQDLSLTLNPGYRMDEVTVNGNPAKAVRDRKEEDGCATWHIAVPVCEKAVVNVRYGGGVQNWGSLTQTPMSGICDEYVSLPPTGIYPASDTDVADDCEFAWTLKLDQNLKPEFTGVYAENLGVSNDKYIWGATSEDYVGVSLTAADYHRKTFEAGGLTIDFLYFAKQESVIDEMNVIDVMKAAIDYFTEAYGPLVYRDRLTMLELPASFSGGYAAGNTSAMDETNFAAAGYLPGKSDTPDEGGGGIDTLIHEIAHQWWGLATYPIADGMSDWSAEGLTCYSAYRFIESYYGSEYAREHYADVWKRGWQPYRNAFYLEHPEFLAKLAAADASNVMLNLRSLSLYYVMPLKLLRAEQALGGREAFMEKLSELYKNYLFKPIAYDDFLSETGLDEEALNLA